MTRLVRAISRPATIAAAGFAIAGLLVTACSAPAGSSASSGSAAAGPAAGAHAQPGHVSAGSNDAGSPAQPDAPKSASGGTLLLANPGQQIIYTASLTVRAKDVSAAADTASGYVTSAGGYVSNEQQATASDGRQVANISMEFKIPVAMYPMVLPRLRKHIGTELSFSEQAQDVTQQVADIGSRVSSAQAAIAQLRDLLAKAGSVSDLLSVQQEINTQEASLESLQAQQQALAHSTSYATVSLTLVTKARPGVTTGHPSSGGFTGGLKAGWHALAIVVTGLLTGLGAMLPFVIPVALLAGVAYYLLTRRRTVRRRIPPREAS